MSLRRSAKSAVHSSRASMTRKVVLAQRASRILVKTADHAH
jgi:hypothetical protein